jgi:hypothetical protein
MSRFKLQIVQKLIPGLRKEGYTEESDATLSNATGSNPPRSDNPQPARPRPQTPPHAPDYYPAHIPPDNPLTIGRSDLDPFPGMNPSNPFSPPPLFPHHEGDGMFVGPNHPMFSGRVPGGVGGHQGGRWGGDGFLPPMGAPPGARFDPVGPGPFPGGIGGIGGGRGRGGPPGGRHLGEPDNDEFMPPGAASNILLISNVALTS